ncbi:Glutamate--tRNA ligase mitochondrial [Podospora pseudopauciseta]|uniref:glutamate--tRNA ligase n=1 Tax=Podospora pseudopauciseta TaxID=2093780 RepID=A0ABR0H0H9_9PEZI|nr:Glutamate--tRNA ligase mitochondrial [Podospora pseudopauciseta]
MRGNSLPGQQLWSAYGRWKALTSLRRSQEASHIFQQRLCFSCSSKLSHNPDRQARENRVQLPDTPCRTRFAPSPTGYLHLGSLRTALFNYLLARATGGQFVLRIEDTDQSRLVPDAESKLYEDLKWAGLSWDEGPDVNGPFGPYRQSERLPLYHQHAAELLAEGKAYRCFCTPEALEEHKRIANAAGQPTLYPGTCSHISPAESEERAHKGEKFAIRFRSAKTPTAVRDIVYNHFRKKEFEDDYIIIKRDGFPTYHFANVVDDKHMEITHVIRGAEWLISTPKHVELYNAFGWAPPQFGHLGLLVDENRQKLSKRHSGVSMTWYQEHGILPQTLLNFVALLGWRGRDAAATGGAKKKSGPNGDVMSLDEMVDIFNLKFSKGDIIVSLSKLSFLQTQHLKLLPQTLPSNPSLLADLQTRHITPFMDFLSSVESLRSRSPSPEFPSSLGLHLLGDRIPNPRIFSAPYVADLVQIILKSQAHLAKSTTNPPTTPEGNLVPCEHNHPRTPPAFFPLRYLYWTLSPSALRSSLETSCIDISTVTVNSQPCSLSQAVDWLIGELKGIPEEEWTKEYISLFLAQRKEAIGFKEGEKVTRNTWKICRWAVLAGEEGLTVPLSMEVLGKEETVRRLEAAGEVAREGGGGDGGDAFAAGVVGEGALGAAGAGTGKGGEVEAGSWTDVLPDIEMGDVILEMEKKKNDCVRRKRDGKSQKGRGELVGSAWSWRCKASDCHRRQYSVSCINK